MKIYLVRHGQSEGNKYNLTQTSETPLSKEGIKQSQKVAKRIKSLSIDFIYSSPFVRTKQTAEIISKETGIQIEYWQALHEVLHPSEIWDKPKEDSEVKRVQALVRENYYKGDWKYSDEETPNELIKRATGILNHLLEQHEGQNVLCVTHGALMKTLTALAVLGLELTPKNLLHFRHHTWDENTGITVIEHTDKYGWALLHWNDVAHL